MTGARIVVMGPSGSGKSLIGAALAQQLACAFVDADDLHPAQNVAKMAGGVPLDDEDRMPWLDRVGAVLHEAEDGIVVACSALARRYRDRIRLVAPGVVFVELRVDAAELERRMRRRSHFMPPALLASQLDALEHLGEDEPGFAVDGSLPPAELVRAVAERLA